MRIWLRGLILVGFALLIAGPPVALYRANYAHAKRLREVTPGRFYRSGQMTAAGLRETIDRYKIRTVINLQHEDPDPLLADHWLGRRGVREKQLCADLNVRYVLLTPDILPEPNSLTTQPPVVKDFLTILDDQTAYPILLHCKAGLHRTGRLTAIYRMEYEDWSVGEAMRELRANGYGFVMSSEMDDFVIQFIQNYKPRPKPGPVVATPASTSPAGGKP